MLSILKKSIRKFLILINEILERKIDLKMVVDSLLNWNFQILLGIRVYFTL